MQTNATAWKNVDEDGIRTVARKAPVGQIQRLRSFDHGPLAFFWPQDIDCMKHVANIAQHFCKVILINNQVSTYTKQKLNKI